MKKLQCTNCGGKIHPTSLRCSYCGTQYEQDSDNVLHIETFTNPVKVYQSKMLMPKDEVAMMGAEMTSEMCIRELSRNLAEALAANMEIEESYEPMLNSYSVTARVRIVEPGYKF